MQRLLSFLRPARPRMDTPAKIRFRDVELVAVEHNGQPWIRATDLARALGYAREDKVSRIYTRHADEFTDTMTQVIEIVVEPHFGGSGNLNGGRARIFSPRGCHLIAMLARTPIAKDFRKWLLNLIDALAQASDAEPRRWREIINMCESYENIFIETGRVLGHLDRYTPERQRLCLKVCELRQQGMTQTKIATSLSTSVYVVRRLLRLHYAWLGTSTDRRFVEERLAVAALGV